MHPLLKKSWIRPCTREFLTEVSIVLAEVTLGLEGSFTLEMHSVVYLPTLTHQGQFLTLDKLFFNT